MEWRKYNIIVPGLLQQNTDASDDNNNELVSKLLSSNQNLGSISVVEFDY